MDDAVNRALIALAVRDVPRASPRQIGEWVAAARLTARDRALVEAAVALRGGWPDRARAILDDVDGGLAGSMRVAAPVVGRNRFPGGRGALFEEGDLAAFEETPPTAGAETDEVLLMVAIGQVDAMVTNWRSLARDGGAEAAGLVIDRTRHLRAALGGTAAPWLHGYLALVEADLLRLAGDAAAATTNWEQAVATWSADGDGLGEAAAHLALGDWLVAPRTSPEALDLILDLSPTAVTTPPDPAGARAAYDRAHALYAGLSCELGLAALALRDGYLAAVAGDAAAWADAAARCEAMARRGGDDWLALLAGVHGALATIWSGDGTDETGLAGRAGTLHAGGSRGWVRGLVRLVVAWSTVRRDAGEFVAARRSLRLARAMADASGAPRETVDVTDRLLDLYGRTSFPAPRAVLELATVARSLPALDAAADPVSWYRLAERAVSAMNMATQVADGALVTAAGATTAQVAAAGPQPPDAMTGALVELLASSAAQAGVLGPLYRARAARRDGRPEEAEPLEAVALAAADALGDGGAMLRAVVLGTIGRREEARAIVDALAGELPPDLLRSLYLRLGATDEAARLLPATDPPSDRPWEASAQRAQILVAEGRLTEAAAAADRGIEAFEQALTRYARDALKTSATEDLDGADLYLARIAADVPAAEAGDADAAARSFATSDRARSVSNVDRVGDERSEPAVRRWLALGSQWAATYEALGEAGAEPAALDVAAAREQVRAVEDDLDDAEDALLAAHPELVVAMRGRRPPLDVATVAAALPAGAVLLQYHCWNDELVSWALTDRGLQVRRARIDTKVVASDGRRFLRASAGEGGPVPDVVERLGALLLDPWSVLLEDHERVVLVPHGALSGIPIHLLGGGAALADRHVVSYVPAASLLPTLAAPDGPAAAARPVLVGDPAYDPGRGLPALPGSGVEARTAARTLGAAGALVGAAATADAVRREAPGASLLHLGTHGILDERSPNRSYLALAGDGQLTAADLFAIDIDGATVVLSACNSGRGRATAGGDVVGLIRAVLASGAGSVVASLWPVGDVAGCLVMTRFYEHLLGGEQRPGVGAAHALHRAASDVRAMSPGDRRDAYAALAERVGTTGEPAASRGLRPVATAGAADTAAWAPFVYVGR